jgi:hypothetical protein
LTCPLREPELYGTNGFSFARLASMTSTCLGCTGSLPDMPFEAEHVRR